MLTFTKPSVFSVVKAYFTPALMGASLVSLAPSAYAEEGAAAGHILNVQPLIEWSRPDGSRTTERSGHWSLLAPAREDTTLAPHQRRRVLFLLDLSASMPKVRGRTQDYPALIADVTARAKAMLEPYRGSTHMVVSLYTFGDLRREGQQWVPFVKAVEGSTEISVDAALAHLDSFIPSESKAYNEAWTYVSASIFEAIRRELDLGKDPSLALPNDAPPLTVFVFTDAGEDGGGESHARNRNFDNRPYATWLKRHQASNQIDYHYWDLGSDLVDMAPAKDTLTYIVSWGQGGRVDTVNRQGALSQHRRTFDIPPVMTATPALGSAQHLQGVRCQARESEEAGQLTRTTLRLPFQGEASFNLGDTNHYAVGTHNVSLDLDTLCAELTRVYPNSEFIFPASSEGATLAPLGFVEVIDQPSYRFELSAEGTAPDAPLVPLQANLNHQFTPQTRTFRMLSPKAEGVESAIDWTLTLLRDGQSLSDSSELATLQVNDSSHARGATHTLDPHASFTLHTPAITQTWYKLGHDFAVDDGLYTAKLCASPRILKSPQPNYQLDLSCPDCTHADTTEHRLCVNILLEIKPRPIHWLWWTALALTLLVLARLLYRYYSGPRLPRNLALTVLEPRQPQKTFLFDPSRHGESPLTQAHMRYQRKVRYIMCFGGIAPSFKSKYTPAKAPKTADTLIHQPMLTLAYRGSNLRGGLQVYVCHHLPDVSIHKPDGQPITPLNSHHITARSLGLTIKPADLHQGYVFEVREHGRDTMKLVLHTRDFGLLDPTTQGLPRFEFPRL